MKRIIALLIAVITLASLVACGKTGEGETVRFNREVGADEIAMSTEHFSITMAEFSYMMSSIYTDFRTNNPEAVDMYNIDTSSSIKDQIYYDDHSWFDEFVDKTVDYLTPILYYCEAAYEAGMTLDDDDNANIKETVDSWRNYCEDYDVSVPKLMLNYFTKDVSFDVMTSYLEKETLATKYQQKYAAETQFEDSEIDTYLSEHEDRYYYVDYKYYTFLETDKVGVDAAAKAEEASKCESGEAFEQYISDYMSEVKGLPVDEQELPKYSAGCVNKETLAKADEGFAAFAFAKNTKVGDTFVNAKEVDGKYTVYIITKTAYRFEEPVRNIIYIDALKENHRNNVEETKTFLQGLIDDWKAGEATEDSFALLAHDKSDDKESAAKYGYAFGILPNSSAQYSKELVDWLYSSDVKAGDTAVVRGGNDDYYAVYLVDTDRIGWKFQAEADLFSETVQKNETELSEKYPVTVVNEVIDGVAL